MSITLETEILNGRRAFAKTQELFAGEPLAVVPTPLDIGWYDTSTHPERGSFAVVGIDADLDDWIGEIVLVSANGRSCYVYVLASADVPTPLSLARRPFCALAALSIESMSATVQVIG